MNELMSPCTFPCWRRSCEYQDPISMNEFLLLLFLRLELAFVGMQLGSKFAVDAYINPTDACCGEYFQVCQRRIRVCGDQWVRVGFH